MNVGRRITTIISYTQSNNDNLKNVTIEESTALTSPVKEYNDKREHGGIYGLTPSEMFLQTFNRSHIKTNTKQQGVTYVGI